jgi:hypothetical protein
VKPPIEVFFILRSILDQWDVGLVSEWQVVEAIRSAERLTRSFGTYTPQAQVEVSA